MFTAKDSIIKVSNLNVGYDEKQILYDINLEIYPGEIVALIGQSGCGKTTLLRCLIGLLEPNSGDIEILGYKFPVTDEEEKKYLLKKIGVVFQQNALLGSLTVGENIELPLMEHSKLDPQIRRRLAETKLAQVGLAGTYLKFPNQLSGGMQKRAALARSIVLDPDILFCDEPIAGLDPVVSSGIDKLMVQLRDMYNITIIMVTHELSSIMSIVDRAIMISEGKICAIGSPSKLAESSNPVVYNFFHRLPAEEQDNNPGLLELINRGV